MDYLTKYGALKSITGMEYYGSNVLKSAILCSESLLHTRYGILIPNYSFADGRKKYRESVSFYREGTMESIYLEDITKIPTSVGDIHAELLTFYENGSLKRLFPLYGQLSGYWTEEAEYALSEEISLLIQGKEQKVKPLCLHFYPTGELMSVTIWPCTRLTVWTKYGMVETKVGAEFYQSGALKSVEPVFGTKLQMEDGVRCPFDPHAFTMHADNNSLKFSESGEILSAVWI